MPPEIDHLVAGEHAAGAREIFLRLGVQNLD
jgi:hypothetical protein